MPPRYAVFAAALTVTGCAGSYDPPLAGDHAAPGYRADLAKCQKQAEAKATRAANATPQSAVAALFTSDEPERQGIAACMAGRGPPAR